MHFPLAVQHGNARLTPSVAESDFGYAFKSVPISNEASEYDRDLTTSNGL